MYFKWGEMHEGGVIVVFTVAKKGAVSHKNQRLELSCHSCLLRQLFNPESLAQSHINPPHPGRQVSKVTVG